MLSNIKKTLVSSLRNRGYTLAPNWKVQQMGLVRHLSEIFETCGIDCVLDVGANTGQFRDLLRKEVGFNGHIISFEPISKNIEHLRRLAQIDPNWHIHGYALGASPGEMSFNVMSDTTLSSFHMPTTSLLGAHLKKNVIERVENVQIETLDRILPEILSQLGVSRAFLKMDTQGFDLEVIKGASNALKDVLLLQTEASVVPIYDGMPDYKLVITELEKLGYALSGIFPVTPIGSLKLIEFDCIMFKKDLFAR